jgi:putative ABC transport system permease protein
MKIVDIISISFKNLFRQKARSVLTIISVMVGAFLISIMLSIGNGLEKFMVSQVTMFSNTRTITVQKDFDAGSYGFAFGGVQEFQEEDVPEMEIPDEEIPLESPERKADEDDPADAEDDEFSHRIEEAMLTTEDRDTIAEIEHINEVAFQGIVSPDYVRLEDEDSKKLQVGLYGMPIGILEELTFSVVDKDLLEREDAVVLSDGYAELWEIDKQTVVGDTVWVRVSESGSTASATVSIGYSVGGTEGPVEAETKEFPLIIAGFVEKSLLSQVGFITSEMANAMNAYASGKDVDEYSSEEKAFELIVIVDNDEHVEMVDKALEELGYQSMTYDETIGQIGVVFDVINGVLSSFGVIAMFVASIGIVNTLLMAIYERTREIGVMKAVGATRGVIGMLFTGEAAWLGFWGGMFGLIISWGLGRIVNAVLHNGISFGEFTLIDGYLKDYPTFDISVFTADMVIIVLLITTGVAVIAGLYPSWRASRLDPIDALRHD